MKRLTALVVAVPILLASSAWGGGKEMFEKKCTRCHGASKTVEKKASKDYWQSLVQRMQKKRSNFISDAEAAQIVSYLAETYGQK